MSPKCISESEIELSILNYLARTGVGFFWKNVSAGYFDGTKWRKQASPFAIRGVPDILGYLYSTGRMVALEVKTKTGRLRPDQETFLKKAQKHHVVCAVVRSSWEAHLVLLEAGEACSAPTGELAT